MYPPFDVLAPETFERAVSKTQIEFFPAGEVILQQGGEPSTHAYVVRTGEVELMDEDRVLDLLGPGEVFGHPSLTTGSGPSLTVRSRFRVYEGAAASLASGERARGEASHLYASETAAAVAMKEIVAKDARLSNKLQVISSYEAAA